ncbi:Two-component sensor histidine kinase, contains HisKA and HATPase domains [Rhodospirillales bacterium URHD0017]|nr:Two-component sensor histidine kinase, contains HisKA and HATPase domains [Rhodospirillales bacterium URHD0017]
MPISSRFVIQSTIVLLAVGLFTLLAIVGMTIWLNERSQTHFQEVIEARDIRSSAVALRSALQAAESSQRGFLLSGNEIYLAPYDSAKAMAQRQLDALRRMLATNGEARPMLERLAAVVGDKLGELDQTIALAADRRDAEAQAILRTNRGKALMDQANVFLSGIERAADERLTEGVAEQRANAALLRVASIMGAVVIVLVVGGVTLTVARYAREIAQARDEVRALNAGLEERVARRTADLLQERDRAEVLLAEVNHRVANSLTLVASLVRLQANALSDQAAKDALEETQGRILAISLVHKRLYSSGDVRFVELDGYVASLLEHLETSMRAEGHGGASLRHELEPLKLTTDASVNLGVVVTEWVTNAFKYAYPDRTGDVRVRLRRLDDGRAELVVEDDGIGREDGAPVRGTGLGTRIVKGIAAAMRADVEYLRRQPGTVARLTFPLPAD